MFLKVFPHRGYCRKSVVLTFEIQCFGFKLVIYYNFDIVEIIYGLFPDIQPQCEQLYVIYQEIDFH